MKNLKSWWQTAQNLPLCNLQWRELLGEKKKRILEKIGALQYTPNGECVSEIFIGESCYNVSQCQGGYVAVNEFGEYFEMSATDALRVSFNKTAFVLHISRILGVSSDVSQLGRSLGKFRGYDCDGFYLGNSSAGKVFFYFSKPKFIEYTKSVLNGDVPVVIYFDEIDRETEMFIAENRGRTVALESIIDFGVDGFKDNGKFRQHSARTKQSNNTAFYSWQGTNLPTPTKLTLGALSMDLVSPSEIKITYGAKSLRAHYADISIFKSNDTSDVSFSWKVVCACALRKDLVGYDTRNLPRYTSRLNAKFRDFFGFPESAFSCKEGVISANFPITAREYKSTRIRSQIFDGISQ